MYIISETTEKSGKNNISRIDGSISMIMSCVIYLTYSLHDKNIYEMINMINGQGHVMRLRQSQMWAKFNNSEQKS